MALQIPTTAELNAAIIAQFDSAYGKTIPVFAKAFLRVLAKVLAGLLTIVYKYGGSIFLQQFVKFAGTEEVYINGERMIPLVEWGRLVGLDPPTAATRAEMDITFNVSNPTGSIAANTQYTNAANGFIYLVTSAVVLTSPTTTVTIKAQGDPDGNGGRGADGNLAVNDMVSLVTPDERFDTDATVTNIITTAANAESWDAYRNRVLDRFRKQPQGGAYADYEAWGEAVEGIINVYPYTGDPGKVNVYCEATPKSSNPDGIPTAAQIEDVEDAIEQDDTGLASRRPVNAYVSVDGITRTALDFEITGLQAATGTDLDPIKTAIDESLDSYCRGREPYISGLTVGKRKDRVTSAEASGAAQDTASAYGAVFTAFVMRDSVGTATTVYSLGEGEKAKAGTVSYFA